MLEIILVVLMILCLVLKFMDEYLRKKIRDLESLKRGSLKTCSKCSCQRIGVFCSRCGIVI